MKTARYPFRVMVPGHPARPMLPVRITNPATGLFVDAWGLVDTGPMIAPFPPSMRRCSATSSKPGPCA